MRFGRRKRCAQLPSATHARPAQPTSPTRVNVVDAMTLPCAQAEREQREEKERKKKENQDKGVSHQVITNTAKIKKMSKKQLRNIKKADTSGVAPKQYGGISKKSLQ